MDNSQEKIEDKLLEILSKEILSISELSRRLNVKRYILTGYLEALREQGKVDVFKVGKAKVYVAKEKIKKSFLLILLFLPFLLPIPSFADVSINITPSNKIWIINSNGTIFYNPSNIVVTTNCNIIFAYLFDSEGREYIIGTNKISANKLSFDTTSFNKDLLSQGIDYFLNLSCDIDSVTVPLNVSYLEASILIVDSNSRVQDLFEDSTLSAILMLKENGNPLSPIEERANLNVSLFINGIARNISSMKYYSESGQTEICFGPLSAGSHVISISIFYDGLPSPIQISQTINVKKRLSIKSIFPQYLSSNISATIALDASIQPLDLNSLSVFIDNAQATILSASGSTITILTPFLSPGEHTLTVNYGKYKDSSRVYYASKITGRILDDSRKPVSARFTIFKNGVQVFSSTTNSTGDYDIALPPDHYDLKVELPQATLYFKDFYFRDVDGLISYFYKDSISIEGLRVYGFYIFEFSGSYSSVNLHLKYNKKNVEDEDNMKVFYCSSWNFATNSCNSKWETIDFILDKVNSKVTLSLDHLSAFVIGREISLKVACSINKKLFYINEKASIVCLVEDEDGNAVENASITLNIKGRVVSGKTSANGIFTYEYLISEEGDFNVSVFVHKNPYLSASSYFTFSAERKKELFISFPDLIRAEVGKSVTLEFSIFNAGQAELSDLQIYFEDLPFKYSISQEHLDKFLVGERKNFTLTIFIPENASTATYSPKIKVVSKELEASKSFGLTLIKTEKAQPPSGFIVRLPQINIDSEYFHLIIFAAISFSLAFFLKRVKSKRRRVSYDDVFSKLEVG